MKVLMEDPESAFPIAIDIAGEWVTLRLRQAESLRDGLLAATGAIYRHFQCTDESGTKSVPGFRCQARGTVKQSAGIYLCKRHAKRAAKELK